MTAGPRVLQRRGVSAVIAQKLVADAIEFVCGDSGRDIAADLGKGLGAKPQAQSE